MDRAEAVIPAQGARTVPAAAPADAGAAAPGLTALKGRAPGVRLDPYLLAGVFFVAYLLLSVTRWRRMLTMSWDLGIFEQAVKSYAHLHAPVADLKGPGFDILGDHFSPITALIAPFYRVFPSPVTLLVAQALLFALSVVPVTRVAGRLLGRGRGLAIGTAYALSWGVQRAVEFDFHEIAFAMPLLAFSLEAVLLKRWTAAMWWAVPLVFVKEDMGITAAAIGVIVWWRTRQEPLPGAPGTVAGPDLAGSTSDSTGTSTAPGTGRQPLPAPTLRRDLTAAPATPPTPTAPAAPAVAEASGDARPAVTGTAADQAAPVPAPDTDAEAAVGAENTGAEGPGAGDAAQGKAPAQGTGTGTDAAPDRATLPGPGTTPSAVPTPAPGAAAAGRPLSDGERYGPWAMGLTAFGVAASALAFAVIIPAFNKAGGYAYWNKLNGHGAPMPGHIPFDTAFHTLLWILLPTSGLLALRSPLLLAALPTIGWRFVSHDDHYWGTDWHYSAVLMPVVLLALVDAADRSRRSRMPWLRSYASGVPAAVAGAALALSLSMPLASLTHGDTYKVDARTTAVGKLLDRIPDGVTVEANVGPISHLVSRTTVYWVGDTPGVVPDYIAIDNSDGWAGDPATYATQLHPGVRYTVVGNAQGYVVLRRAA